jgi:thymidylate synthase
MRVLFIIQGSYGQRMVDNVKTHAPVDWEVRSITIPLKLPAIIDDSSEFLPHEFPQADLLVSLGEHPGVAQMIPDMVERSGATAVIAPADNRVWLPAGLARQIQQKLQKKFVDMVYPVPFCLLAEKDSQNSFIREFAHHFGVPVFELDIDEDKVGKIRVSKEAPCGSTRYVACHLPGTRLTEAVEQAGLQHHQYPCLATMTIDKEFEDTLMHRAGLAAKQAVEKAIKANRAKAAAE